MKKGLLLLVLMIGGVLSDAQSDSVSMEEMKVDILKAHKLYSSNHLDLHGYDFSNEAANKELYAALQSRNKSTRKAVAGGIFVGLGLLIYINTYLVFQEFGSSYYTKEVGHLVGSMSGLIPAAVSVPFFISSARHKKEAKRHITIVKEMYGGN